MVYQTFFVQYCGKRYFDSRFRVKKCQIRIFRKAISKAKIYTPTHMSATTYKHRHTHLLFLSHFLLRRHTQILTNSTLLTYIEEKQKPKYLRTLLFRYIYIDR